MIKIKMMMMSTILDLNIIGNLEDKNNKEDFDDILIFPELDLDNTKEKKNNEFDIDFNDIDIDIDDTNVGIGNEILSGEKEIVEDIDDLWGDTKNNSKKNLEASRDYSTKEKSEENVENAPKGVSTNRRYDLDIDDLENGLSDDFKSEFDMELNLDDEDF